MGQPINIAGQRFGFLLAIAPTEKRSDSKVIWRFSCDCGREVEKTAKDAKSGNTTSCSSRCAARIAVLRDQIVAAGAAVRKICAQCGREYRVKASYAMKSSYCSRTCMAKAYSARLAGAANPNYKHGLSLTVDGSAELSRRWKVANPQKYAESRAHTNRRTRGIRRGVLGLASKQDLTRLWNQQDGKCAACKSTLIVEGAHLDHRIPIRKGGTGFIGNLQYLCAQCNVRKKTMLPIEHRIYNLLKSNEEIEQALVFKWARKNADRLPDLAMLMHIPNGGLRNKREAAKLMAIGVRKGVPDMVLASPRAGAHGLYIELKAGKNKPTVEQAAWIAALKDEGYEARVAHGASAAIDILERYLKQPK